MNELKIFNNPEFGKIRTAEIDGEPWFVGRDVAAALGYKETSKAVREHVAEDDKGMSVLDTPGGKQSITVINESGLYALVLSSKLPTARKFKRWVTSEVLPAIRRNGAYMTPEVLEQTMKDPDFLIGLLKRLKREQQRVKALEAETAQKTQLIGELKPKADYTDRILQSKGTVPVTAIAKDYGMSGAAMNRLLHELHIIYKMGGQWLLYYRYQAKGYTHSKTVDIKHKDGSPDVKMHTEWTQKGRLFLYEKLKRAGYLPMIEQEA